MAESALNAFESTEESDAGAPLDQRNAFPKMRRRGFCVVTTLLLSGAAAIFARGAWRVEERNSEVLATQKYEETVVIPPYEQCSKISEDCMSTKCCKASGYTCFLLKENRASCRQECTPGKDGLCTALVSLKPIHTLGTRLFCFGFYTENTGSTKKSYELSLFRKQLSLGLGLFACSKWAVYSDVETSLSPGPPMELNTIKVDDVDGDFKLFKRKKTGTWVNAMMFYQAWMHIRNNKLTLASETDWVVKVDADAVFIPVRLIHTLQGFKVPEGGVYIENCKKVKFGFFGNLEVVSQEGFNSFLTKLEFCKSTLDWKGEDPNWKYGPWGEDLFLQKCLDKIGVPKVSNFTMTADGACKADRPTELQKVKNLKWQPNCRGQNAVSYHPFKKPDEWFECLRLTMEAS